MSVLCWICSLLGYHRTTQPVARERTWSHEELIAFADDFTAWHPRGFSIDRNQSITLQLFKAFEEVPFEHHSVVFAELARRGIGIVRVAQMDDGTPLLLPFELCDGLTGPIVLSKEGYASSMHSLGEDEFFYSTQPDTWRNRGGRAGLAKVRDGQIIALQMTSMS